MRPNIVISRCINLEPVRYNGGIVNDEFAKKLEKFVNFIPVCPEVDIGMPVPRLPVILVKEDNTLKMIEPETNKDYTNQLNLFSENFINSLKNIDGFLLKSKSPSCGVKSAKIYKRGNKSSIGKRSGLFAQKAIEKYPYLPVEDEGRLKDKDIRTNFLIKIFAFANLRETLSTVDNINTLIKFHERYKYLLMLYNQTNLKKLGHLLANWKDISLEETKKQYEEIFRRSFNKKPSVRSHVNVLQHIYGYFSKYLTAKEKDYILKMFDRLLDKKIELNTVVAYIKSFAFRFENEYLINQAYFNPYPEELE